jgi:MFS transporter, ACS family, glucarate transporter
MNERPTRVRYVVLAFACALSMITYLDRVCFGQVASTLVSELSLDSVADLKWAFTAFTLAYAIFEIPTGWLGDAWGPRGTLLRIVIWWSICTALTALVGLQFGTRGFGGLGLLIVLRFLFGMGEAGAYPNITRALHNWFPTNQTATAQGWVWMSGRLMGGLTPMIWTLIVVGTTSMSPLVSWRGAFILFGMIGVAWCVAFWWFFRDHPHDHPSVNAAERTEIERGREASEALHTGIPWRSFLRSGNLWLLCLMYFCMAYGWYFNITYLPSYLKDRFQLDPRSLVGAIYQGGPLWIGAFSCLAGGILVDWLIRRTGDRKRTRRIVGATAETLCALGWIAAIFAPNVHLFFLAISLAALCNDLTLASAWATCQDIGQRYTAVTAACMNTVGTLGAAVAGWLTGTLVENALTSHAVTLDTTVKQLAESEKLTAMTAGFNLSFATYAAAYFVSAICWRLIDCTEPIVDPSAPESNS